MRCKEYEKMLVAYLDGELGPAENTGVAQHLKECPQCEAETVELAVLHKAISAGKDIDPSADFDAGLRAKLAKTKAGDTLLGFPRFLPFPLLAATALVVGLFLGGLVFDDRVPRTTLGPHLALELANFGETTPNSLQVHYLKFMEAIK